ncbi:MAG TPA: ATP-binding protein [Nannocystaceae bacterium]|nr:ATP-binding protein [Nannocystaceae bacterium]
MSALTLETSTDLLPFVPPPDEHAAEHAVQFYDSDQGLGEVVADFAEHGLWNGDGVVVIVTPAHRRCFLGALAARGIDPDAVMRGGQLIVLDAIGVLRTFMHGGLPDPVAFRTEIGGALDRATAAGSTGRSRAFGEMVDVLWRDGEREATLVLEQLWSELQRKRRLSLLCAYSIAEFSRVGDVREVCECHGHVLVQNGPEREGLEVRALAADIGQRKNIERELRASLRDVKRKQEQLEESERRLKESLEEARRDRERAEAASSAKDQFLAMLGHELRNPLSPILTALELMRLRLGQTVWKERTIIERQVKHMVHLVDDLLDVSRITQGKLSLRLQPLQISDVVAKAVEMASPLLEERRHRLVTTIERNGLLVDGDEHRLAQVVHNLLMNAAKYTEPGGLVEVRASREGGFVELSVRDSGMGIAPALMPTLFDAFVQGQHRAPHTHAGLGLGLAIVRSLVAMHGGTVGVRSDGIGRGSEFTVRLPLALQACADAPLDLEAARTARRRAAIRVLVVDDNEDAACLLAEILHMAGYETAIAGDGPHALRLARELMPQIAVLDIGLPVMDGYELARELRRCPGLDTIRMVAVTGYGQASDRERALAVGFDEHLMKPVPRERIEAVLDGLALQVS